MRSKDAQVGTRARAHDNCLNPEMRGKVGTIAKRWGHSDYVALDVVLDDGESHLFWHHELESVEEKHSKEAPRHHG
jgi:hypothetical protein